MLQLFSPLKLTTSLEEPSRLAMKQAGAHQGLGLSQHLITPSLRSLSMSFLEDFESHAGALEHVVHLFGLAPRLTLILMGATAA